MTRLAPGARAVIRDEEWLIRRVDLSTDGGWLLTCDGISDLVRGQSALFLTVLEGEIEVLDPATTQLVSDESPTYNATLLYLESQRRRTVPNDESIHLGHRGVMNLVPYQLDPALQALHQPRARILIADAVGLGKTLEAGVLATELIQRGRGKRILVVTQKSMLTQFQKEWWSRFSIPLVRLDSVGLARVRNRIPANHNPFNHFDRSIISIDTLKSNLEYRNYLENAWWDIIVIDECHNVAASRTTPKTRITTPDGKVRPGNHGWEDLHKDGTPQVPDGTVVTMEVLDDTLPGGPRQVTRTFKAPFARASREDDYRTAWAFFEDLE